MFKKYQAVFMSRWKALWWAVGVCLTAYCTVPAADQADSHFGLHFGKHAKHKQQHVNPWALKKDEGS